MEYFTEIIKKVAVFYVIAYFLMNLVNNEKYKHYIKMFVGIVMIIMIASPIAGLFGMDVKFEKLFSLNKAQGMSEDMEEELKLAENGMKEAVLSEYYTLIEEDIREKLLTYDAYLVDCRITICTDEEREEFGKLTAISLDISNKQNKNIEIKDIVIQDKGNSMNPVAIEIKKYISDVYKINTDNINVNISL